MDQYILDNTVIDLLYNICYYQYDWTVAQLPSSKGNVHDASSCGIRRYHVSVRWFCGVDSCRIRHIWPLPQQQRMGATTDRAHSGIHHCIRCVPRQSSGRTQQVVMSPE